MTSHTDITIVVKQHAIVGKISSFSRVPRLLMPHDCTNQVGMTFPQSIPVAAAIRDDDAVTTTTTKRLTRWRRAQLSIPFEKTCTMTAPTKRATRSFARVTKARARLRGPLVVAITPALDHEPLVTQH
jgi:hypothetical protein